MERLNIDIDKTTSTLEIEALMRFFKELITTLQASETTADVLIKVMYQLAETDIDTCRWVLDNFYDLEAYLELIEKIAKFATQILIDKGFIPGQDFSANPAGGILTKRKASAVLMEETAAFDRLLLEDIVQVLD
jgi:hypothetical protein